MQKTIVLALLLVLCHGTVTGKAHAARDPLTLPPEEVVTGMSEKIVRGVANLATGWMEFPRQIFLTFKNDGVTKGIFVGPLKGVGMTVVRTATGAAEIATFYLPYPEFYDPFFKPEFVWQKE